MDDRKPPESNVVRLRRDGEPDEEERRRLSRTIFASEDEVGTFSRGNLLLPPHDPPPPEPAAEPDPFFDQLQSPDQSATPGVSCGDRADTAAYFERLGSQTAAEMSPDATGTQPTGVSMPGSARLPAEIDKPRRRAARRNRAATSDEPAVKPTVSRRRSRFALAPVAAATGVLVVAGAALAAIVAGNGHSGATHRPLATHQSNSGSAATAFLASSIGASKEQAGTSPRRVVGQHRSEAQHHRRVGARQHGKQATRGTTTPPASSSPPASTMPVSATQPMQSNPAPQESASAASSSTSGSSGSGSAGSSHQPVWGANGILGPGHSPNG
jgi:hypothetical protein